MARTMKAGVVHAFGKPLTIEEVPIPTPGPGELLKFLSQEVLSQAGHSCFDALGSRPLHEPVAQRSFSY
jgi:Zn-dependent alcohol dehydrogenase